MNDLTKITDAEGRALIHRAADIEARFILINLADALYADAKLEGCAACFHAVLYLEDRLKYERMPPPFRMAVPLVCRGPVSA